MTAIRVVNVRGLRTPEERAAVVYVGRRFAGWPAHPLANPFKVRSYGNGGASVNAQTAWVEKERGRVLAEYRAWLLARPTLDADLLALWEQTRRGDLPLGCWCCEATAGDGSPLVCHGQFLAEMLAERFGSEPPTE